MQIDTSTLNIGDRLFDLVREWGVVTRIGDKTLTVSFGPTQVAFAPSGVAQGSGRRTLYWQDPVFFAPTKSATTWAKQCHVLAAVASHFASE
jgi:hypothetical protein